MPLFFDFPGILTFQFRGKIKLPLITPSHRSVRESMTRTGMVHIPILTSPIAIRESPMTPSQRNIFTVGYFAFIKTSVFTIFLFFKTYLKKKNLFFNFFYTST